MIDSKIKEIRSFCIENAKQFNIDKYFRYFKDGFNGYGLDQKVFEVQRDKWIMAFFLFHILATLSGYSQHETKLHYNKPEQEGIASERLDRIQQVMQRYIDENKLPGMITMVARHGKVVHFEKYGLMDVGKPMQFNTIFRMASMTKPVTSVAVMMLYEEGHFQLDDPVGNYIGKNRCS